MGDDHRGRTRGVTARDDVVQRPRNSAADEDDVPHEMVFAACSGGQRVVTTGYDQAGRVPGHRRLPLAGLAVHPMGECWLRVARGSAGGATSCRATPTSSSRRPTLSVQVPASRHNVFRDLAAGSVGLGRRVGQRHLAESAASGLDRGR